MVQMRQQRSAFPEVNVEAPLTAAQMEWAEAGWIKGFPEVVGRLLIPAQGINKPRLATAFRSVVAHHPALRLRLRGAFPSWQIAVKKEDHAIFQEVMLAATSERDRVSAIQSIADAMRAKVDARNGP